MAINWSMAQANPALMQAALQGLTGRLGMGAEGRLRTGQRSAAEALQGGDIRGAASALVNANDPRGMQMLMAQLEAEQAARKPRVVGNDLIQQNTQGGYDTLYRAPQKPMEVSGALVDPGSGSEIYRAPDKPRDPIRVGNSIVDPETYQPLYTAPETPKPPPRRSATESKAIWEAEDENVNLQGTIQNLEKALTLTPSSFEGAGAGSRAWLGSRLPDGVVPDVVADPNAARATTEWQNLMSPEAIQTMAATLKGATTNFELQKFEKVLSDPTAPREVRENTIRRMLDLSRRKQALNDSRIDELRGGDLIAGPSQVDTTGALDAARAAIDAGADPAAVQQRLIEAGIDPAGL